MKARIQVVISQTSDLKGENDFGGYEDKDIFSKQAKKKKRETDNTGYDDYRTQAVGKTNDGDCEDMVKRRQETNPMARRAIPGEYKLSNKDAVTGW